MKRRKTRPAPEEAEPPAFANRDSGGNSGEKTGESHAIAGFPPAQSRHNWLLGFLLAVATIMAYQPVWHAGFIWDDDQYVTANPLLTASDGLRRIWFSCDSPSQYFPLTYTTFYFERSLWGLNPAGYHLVNLVLHAANVLLVWRLLWRLRVPGAWLAAGIFALHPVQVESVAWITERKNVLMGFFFLLSLLAWVKFLHEQCKHPWRYYVLALVFYVVALSAKTTACTLPAALLLILWLKKMPINWRRQAQIMPFLAIGFGMGLVTVWWERHHQGTQGHLFEMGPVERVLLASRAAWFYAGKLLWPTNLTFSYPRWMISASDPRAYGWILATIALGVVIWRVRGRVGRGLEVAAVYFATTLSPVLGIIMLYTFRYSFVADHYQYLACIGPIALAAAGINAWPGHFRKFLQPALCVAVLLVLGTLTWKQCGIYANDETLWQQTIRRNPDCWMAYNWLGLDLEQRGRADEAIACFQTALHINPEGAETHNNLGRAMLQRGQLDEAITHFRTSLRLQPYYKETHINLGHALVQEGGADEAMAQYREALKIDPHYAEAHNNLGNALLQKGQTDEAIAHFQQALDSRPDYAEAHNNLGIALRLKGRVGEAISQCQKALEINPAFVEACYNLAVALGQQGKVDEAIAHYQKAIELARAAGQQDLAGRFDIELTRYQSGLPLSH
ncbi:MAG: tetratricopeptide repeat protein [Verrucomicrobiota bacterium]|jgi:tetratricopeptide (TPR) repeat protein